MQSFGSFPSDGSKHTERTSLPVTGRDNFNNAKKHNY